MVSEIFNLESLTSYFEKIAKHTYSCRLISICQTTSWSPLQISQPMLEAIVKEHDINSSFWQLPLTYFDHYKEGIDLEQAFCVPYAESRSESCAEISYTLKYPLYKSKAGEWTIRQTGLYHKFDHALNQSTLILFNASPLSKSCLKAENFLKNNAAEVNNSPFWLHLLLFTEYLPAWRQRIQYLERQIMHVSKPAFAASINDEATIQIQYQSLSSLASLGIKLIQEPALIDAAICVLDELSTLLDSMGETVGCRSKIQILRNHRRQCIAYTRSVLNLGQQGQNLGRLIADTLHFRDQHIAAKQNKNVIFITRLSLVYLPPSFIATIFGMNFFDMDQEKSTIVATSMIWIFFACSVLLIAVTYGVYWWLVNRKQITNRWSTREWPKPSQINMKTIRRQFTRKPEETSDLQIYSDP